MKKYILFCLFRAILAISQFFVDMSFAESVGPPSFNSQFADTLKNKEMKEDSAGRIEGMFDWKVDRDKSIKDNVLALFYPKADGTGGQIRDLLRIVMFAVVFIMLVWTGIGFLKDAGDGKEKDHASTLMFIGLGAVFVLTSTWILGTALNFSQGSAVLVSDTEKNLFFQILSFLKAVAFFAAIILLIRHGYQIMMVSSKEDRIDKGKAGILNITVTLIFIKGIDYIYYIAQLKDFKEKVTELIIEASKMLARVIGAFMLLTFLYAGFRLLTDGGKGEGFSFFKKVVVGILLGAMVIFLFLLIIYQVVQEFVP